MSILLEAHFVKSVAEWRDLPPDTGTEVAFVGRSNAGKSTAINAVVRHKLAFVSRTPGRTQTINFYSCGEGQRLVDLPGYGYAAVPLKERKRWGELISAYLQKRHALQGIIAIMDARHPFTELDRQLLAWLSRSPPYLHVLLTKADKLTRQEAHNTLRACTEVLSDILPSATLQLFSGTTGMGVSTVQKLIWNWLHKKTPG